MDKNILEIIENNISLFVSRKYPRTVNCQYWAVREDGSHVDLTSRYYCHSGLRDREDRKAAADVAIINQVQTPLVPLDVAQRYYDWLLQQSPYSEAYLTKDLDLSLEHPTIIVDTSHPYNLVAAACIATRFASEDYGRNEVYQHCNMWGKLTSFGMNPDAAFVLAHEMKPTYDGWSFTPATSGHTTLNHSPRTFWNFCNHTPDPKVLGEPYSRAKRYVSSNLIWERSVDQSNPNPLTIIRDVSQKVMKKRKGVSTNPFDISFVTKTYGDEELMEIVPVVNNLLKGEIYAQAA